MRKFILFSISFFISASLFSQGIINNGASIVVSGGTTVNITSGGYLNQTNGSDGSIDLDGIIKLTGDFTNNATAGNVFINVDTDGEVIFAGLGTQNITGNGPFVKFEKITIASGTTQIPAGKAATVNGNLTVIGTFNLLTPADENPSASLITNANIGGSGTVNIQRFFKVANRWQYVSVPMDGTTSDFFTQNNGSYLNPNFYTYNEAWNNPTDPENSNYSNWSTFGPSWTSVQTVFGSPAALTEGTGYIWYNDANLTKTFTTNTPSNVHTGDLIKNVTRTSNDGPTYGNYYDGWNIVGNPFPSAIDWDGITKTNIDATVYMWDGDVGNYVYYNGTPIAGTGQTQLNSANARYINAMQTFFVHRTTVGASTFTLANTARTHSTVPMFKNSESTADFIKLKAVSGELSDETVVRFYDISQPNFDPDFDAYKMFAWNTAIPMIFSITNAPEFPLAINTLPLSAEGQSIPLGFKTAAAGYFNIEATEMNFAPETEVYLIDTYTNTKIDLRMQNSYGFNFDGGENRERFYLFIGPNSGTEIPSTDAYSIEIYSFQKNVVININSSKIIDGKVEIFNILGEIVCVKNISGPYSVIPVNTAAGYYIAKVIDENGATYTQKIYIGN